MTIFLSFLCCFDNFFVILLFQDSVKEITMNKNIAEFTSTEMIDYNAAQKAKYDVALEAVRLSGVADIQDFALQLASRYSDNSIKPILESLRDAVSNETFGTLDDAYNSLDALIEAASKKLEELDSKLLN